MDILEDRSPPGHLSTATGSQQVEHHSCSKLSVAPRYSWVKWKFLPREHEALPTFSGLCPALLSLSHISSGRPVFLPFLK